LPGSDPALAAETLIVSGHHDHNGASEVEEQNGPRHLDIWHGADDNGSGTVGVVELAHAFAAIPSNQSAPILFVVLRQKSAGLLGSYYMAQHPCVRSPLPAMVNFDMNPVATRSQARQTDGVIEIPADTSNRLNLVGTLYSPDFLHTASTRKTSTSVSPSTTAFERDTALRHLLPVRFSSPSFLHDVPARSGFLPAFIRTTTTSPDTVDKIDFSKMTKIVRLSYLTLFTIADEKQTPKFVRQSSAGK